MITLACLDLAGTTVADDGVVEAAFRAALEHPTENDIAYVRATMGMSKIVVFRNLFDGDEAAAQSRQPALRNGPTANRSERSPRSPGPPRQSSPCACREFGSV